MEHLSIYSGNTHFVMVLNRGDMTNMRDKILYAIKFSINVDHNHKLWPCLYCHMGNNATKGGGIHVHIPKIHIDKY